MAKYPVRLTTVINTFNEAHLLAECVKSVWYFSDEIVVCDMESQDGCVELAESMGCRVITHPRLDAPEPDARIAAIEAATGEWIFVCDADMRVPKETSIRIREIVEFDECDVVDFNLRNFVFGKWCLHGHGSQPVFRKMFKKSFFHPSDRNIQTFWHDSVSGRVNQFGRSYPILHYSYETVEECVHTLFRYAQREAEQAMLMGVEPSIARMLFRPIRRFLGNYFLRRGFLDGIPGLILNSLVSWYLFVSEASLWVRTREARKGSLLGKST